MEEEKKTISFEEAEKLLPDGEEIHTFLNPAGMLIGADWARAAVIHLLKTAPEIHVTGEQAQRMNHGLAAKGEHGFVFIQTKVSDDKA